MAKQVEYPENDYWMLQEALPAENIDKLMGCAVLYPKKPAYGFAPNATLAQDPLGTATSNRDAQPSSLFKPKPLYAPGVSKENVTDFLKGSLDVKAEAHFMDLLKTHFRWTRDADSSVTMPKVRTYFIPDAHEVVQTLQERFPEEYARPIVARLEKLEKQDTTAKRRPDMFVITGMVTVEGMIVKQSQSRTVEAGAGGGGQTPAGKITANADVTDKKESTHNETYLGELIFCMQYLRIWLPPVEQPKPDEQQKKKNRKTFFGFRLPGKSTPAAIAQVEPAPAPVSETDVKRARTFKIDVVALEGDVQGFGTKNGEKDEENESPPQPSTDGKARVHVQLQRKVPAVDGGLTFRDPNALPADETEGGEMPRSEATKDT